MSKDLFLPHIRNIEGYIPGEQPRAGEYIKLNTNENPYPPSPNVIIAVRNACNSQLHRYPDPDAYSVVVRLSKLFGISEKQIVVGNGSDELLNVALRCFAGTGQKVALPFPTYPYYQKLIELQNAVAQRFDLDENFSIPEDFPPTDANLSLLANPNSPTGTAIDSRSVGRMATQTQGVLLVDEAYVDFSDVGCIDLIEHHSNLLVLRTMSKSFSLAAMRIGFCFGHPDLISGLRKVVDHYNVNALSQIAASTALDEIDYMKSNVVRIRATRERLEKALKALGFYVWDSNANFVLARIESPPAAELHRILKERCILVRYFNEVRLENCLRISVGTDIENDRLIKELTDII